MLLLERSVLLPLLSALAVSARYLLVPPSPRERVIMVLSGLLAVLKYCVGLYVSVSRLPTAGQSEDTQRPRV